MDIVVANTISLHGQISDIDKGFICFIELRSDAHLPHPAPGIEARITPSMWIRLPWIRLTEKQLQDFERAFYKFFDKKDMESCVGEHAELTKSIAGEAIILKRGLKTFNTAKWYRDTFKGLFDTNLNTHIKKNQEALDKRIEYYNTEIANTNEWLEASKIEG